MRMPTSHHLPLDGSVSLGQPRRNRGGQTPRTSRTTRGNQTHRRPQPPESYRDTLSRFEGRPRCSRQSTRARSKGFVRREVAWSPADREALHTMGKAYHQATRFWAENLLAEDLAMPTGRCALWTSHRQPRIESNTGFRTVGQGMKSCSKSQRTPTTSCSRRISIVSQFPAKGEPNGNQNLVLAQRVSVSGQGGHSRS